MWIAWRNGSQVRASLGTSAEIHQAQRQLVVRVRVLWLDSQDFLKARNCFFQSFLGLVKHAQVVLSVRQIGIDIAGAAEEDNGGFR